MNIPPTMTHAHSPARKPKKWPWITAAIVVGFMIAGIVIGATDETAKVSSSPPAPTTTAVTTTTMDPARAAASSSAAQAFREKAAAEASEAASQSSDAARKASEAAEAQRKADEEADRKANEITYTVTTTGPGISSITYSKPDFDISQETNVKGRRWSKTIQGDGDMISIGLTAQNDGGGTITCSIARGGKVVKENSSSGPYAVVTCG